MQVPMKLSGATGTGHRHGTEGEHSTGGTGVVGNNR